MARGRIGRRAKTVARKAYRTALRTKSKKRLAKKYATVSGKLVAVTAKKRLYKRKVRRKRY